MSASDLRMFRRGKVRDLYELDGRLLIVASDRVSAYDRVLPDPIPGKGEALTKLSAMWFEKTQNIFPNHFLECRDARSMVVSKAERIDIEWVARGHLYGSMWRAYESGVREFDGRQLPGGMRLAEELPETMLTPTTKADTGHDLDISKQEAAEKGLVTAREWEELKRRLSSYTASTRLKPRSAVC